MRSGLCPGTKLILSPAYESACPSSLTKRDTSGRRLSFQPLHVRISPRYVLAFFRIPFDSINWCSEALSEYDPRSTVSVIFPSPSYKSSCGDTQSSNFTLTPWYIISTSWRMNSWRSWEYRYRQRRQWVNWAFTSFPCAMTSSSASVRFFNRSRSSSVISSAFHPSMLVKSPFCSSSLMSSIIGRLCGMYSTETAGNLGSSLFTKWCRSWFCSASWGQT
mmetsp:Transcript_5736/g.13951  ORF Transcript_5736/g.13951 Transcript_5736/m.13951 type:complete len:219 (-) Transcript_5736:189-845(-)